MKTRLIPSKCVHILPVSVCILKIDLKHARKELRGFATIDDL